MHVECSEPDLHKLEAVIFSPKNIVQSRIVKVIRDRQFQKPGDTKEATFCSTLQFNTSIKALKCRLASQPKGVLVTPSGLMCMLKYGVI